MSIKKLSALVVLALSSVSGLASCSSSDPSTTIVLSGPAEAQSFTLEKAAEWAEANPKSDGSIWQFSYSVIGEDVVDSTVVNWSSNTAPAIYMFANDKTQPLSSANAITEVTTSNLATMRDEYGIEEGYIDSVTFNGAVYGYPYTLNGYTFCYNSETIEEYLEEPETYLPDYMVEDFVGNYDNLDNWTMDEWLATAEKNGQYITYNLENAYYIAAALCTYGAGWNVSYTESGAVESITSNFSGEQGYKAAATIMHWVQDYEDTLTTAENTQEAPCNDNEDILGCVNGAWSVASSDGGVSSYAADEVSWRLIPAMNYEGEVADTKAFTGSKAFGVNPNKSSGDAERLSDLHSLALYLVSPTVQQERYNYNESWFPTTTEVSVGDNNELLEVLTEQLNNGVMQANLPGTIWSAPQTLMWAIAAGTYHDEATLRQGLEQLDNTLTEVQ